MTRLCDPANQADRREALYRAHRELFPTIFDADGTYRVPPDPTKNDPRAAHLAVDPRENAWHCFAALSGNDSEVALGNAILRQTQFTPGYDFFASALVMLWMRFRDRLENDVRAKCLQCIEAMGPPQAESPGFVGMNDNFGSMAVCALVLGGMVADRGEFVDNGIAKMRKLVERLDTHGAIAEFNSPTYTGITLACMADIAEHATSAEARDLALRIEQQTWFDMAARFHPGSSNMGGPSSRAYMADSCGQMHNGRFAFHVAFGETVQPLSPLRYSYGKRTDLSLHHDKIDFIPGNGAWIAAATYHVPEGCETMIAARTYPFEAIGTAACAFAWRPDDWRTEPDGTRIKFRPFEPYRFAPALMHSYQSADISMSTSSGAHACGSGGQHDHFFMTYRRRVPDAAERLTYEDTRTVFCRYDFNHHEPATQIGLVNDFGRKAAVQHRHTAVVVYRPGIEIIREITAMRVMILMPLHQGDPDAVWVGDRALDGIEGESESPSPVFVRDGQVVLGFRPLEITNYGRDAAVRVRRAEKFLAISFYNYDGPGRSLNFPYQGALYTQNGFVAEASVADSDADVDAFRAKVQNAELSDVIDHGVRRVHYRRPTNDGGDVDLRIEVDPLNEAVIPPAWINGQPQRTPRFTATGVDALPWPTA